MSFNDGIFIYTISGTGVILTKPVNSITITSASIPKSVVNLTLTYNVIGIDNSAFDGISTLTSVTFVTPSNVASIGKQAFRATNIQSISIPNSVTSLGDIKIFNNCTSLTSVTLPINNAFTSIPNQTFNGCTALTSIIIPTNVTSIGTNCFSQCSSLTNMYFFGNIPTHGPNSFNQIGSNNSAYYMNSATGASTLHPW